MSGEFVEIALTVECTVDCLKIKLLQNLENFFVFGTNTSHLNLFYAENDEKKDETDETDEKMSNDGAAAAAADSSDGDDSGDSDDGDEFLDDDARIDVSKMICLYVGTDSITDFSSKYVTSFNNGSVTLDFRNFDLNDTDAFDDWLCRSRAHTYVVHLSTSAVFNATMNADKITERHHTIAAFDIQIHPSNDPVTKDDLQSLLFSLPPNGSRDDVSFFANEGVYSDSVYTHNDFLKETYTYWNNYRL
jgi:hypothetical protein